MIKSALTFKESSRFRRALYLNWLFAILTYSGNDSDESQDEFDGVPSVQSYLELVPFVSKLFDRELGEFYEVREFLTELWGHNFTNHDDLGEQLRYPEIKHSD